MDQIEKFPLDSLDIKQEQVSKLKQFFPEVFTEGDKIDWVKLKTTLGENIEVGKERFGLNWAGKSECFKLIQQPSTGTLIPAKEESINFDTTENLFIEGDNLEVLKLLQKAYFGKVKMIYIDPPYNTGNDFVYTDDFKDNLKNYLELTGQVDSAGKKLTTNVESDGRFHSNWLNMMYPRLFLARNLLREDGVIFISIDDNEVHNLRALCNEIFGEENFVENFSWVKTSTPPGLSNKSRKTIEYILCYEKNLSNQKYKGELLDGGDQPLLNTGNPEKVLCFPSGSVKFKISDGKYEAGAYDRVTLLESIFISDGRATSDIKLRGEFKWIQKTLDAEIEKGTTFIVKTEKFAIRFIRSEEGGYKAPTNLLKDKYISPLISKNNNGVDTNETSSSQLSDLMGGKYFDFPKPVSLIKHLMGFVVEHGDTILDFFAGSGTTGHSVLDLNLEDKGQRKFICVQIPESTEETSDAFKAGYKNIAEIGKDRIRKVINQNKGKLDEKEPRLFSEKNKPLDLGFKVFKLQPSNFSTWDPNVKKSVDALTEQLFRHVDHLSPEAAQDAILYELLLKAGFELTTEITKLTLADKTVFSIMDNTMLICLERTLTHDLLKAIAELKPAQFICLDEGFRDNDQLKSNAVLLMKQNGVQKFQTV